MKLLTVNPTAKPAAKSAVKPTVPKKVATMRQLVELKARGYSFDASHLPVTTAHLVSELDQLRSEVEDLKVRLLLVERRHEEAP